MALCFVLYCFLRQLSPDFFFVFVFFKVIVISLCLFFTLHCNLKTKVLFLVVAILLFLFPPLLLSQVLNMYKLSNASIRRRYCSDQSHAFLRKHFLALALRRKYLPTPMTMWQQDYEVETDSPCENVAEAGVLLSVAWCSCTFSCVVLSSRRQRFVDYIMRTQVRVVRLEDWDVLRTRHTPQLENHTFRCFEWRICCFGSAY